MKKCDLYHIPGDTGGEWRLRKFVEYQNAVPSHNPIFLNGYIELHPELTIEDYIWLSWIESVTYSGASTVFLFNAMIEEFVSVFKVTEDWCNKFWKAYKGDLVFNSARRYVKANDKFTNLIMDFKKLTNGQPEVWLNNLTKDSDRVENHTRILKEIKKLNYVGGFSSGLFMSMLYNLQREKFTSFNLEEKLEFDWNECANTTSGLFNLMYMDDEANEFDRTHRVKPEYRDVLLDGLKWVCDAVYSTYPETRGKAAVLIAGKICSFRNLFKNARYAGFHHDRELGTINHYKTKFPEYKDLWEECFAIRKKKFSPKLLGEIGGWDGIRKEKKKQFLQKGLTGAEGL